MKKRAVIAAGIAVLLGAAIFYFWFVPEGYRMSIALHSAYREIAPHVYADSTMDSPENLALVAEARARVAEFYGTLRGEPDIILSSDENAAAHLGGDRQTFSLWFPIRHSWIVVSESYCTLDILAHEMTHAELHSLADYGTIKQIPTWFDEGLATQNDYREQYSAAEWETQTGGGKTALPRADMDTPEEFYAGTAEERRFRYLCAKHEVAVWLEEEGVKGLRDMISMMNAGKTGFRQT